MMARRFSIVLLVVIALLSLAIQPVCAQKGYGGTGPFSIEFTHQGLYGATYRSRFTIEGAVGIQPTGQGTGSDYAYLAGYADPNGTITVTMEWIECTDPDNDFQWKHVDIWMGNRFYNGDAQRDDDNQQFTRETKSFDNSCDKVVYTFNCSDYQMADPSVSEPILMVNASSGVQVGSAWSECLVYLKLTLDEKAGGGDGGLHVKEDHDASDEKGSTKYLIPGIIGSVLIGGGAAAAALTGKKKDEEDGGGDEGEGEEPEQEPDWLEMEIYKDFGNTLIVGDAAETVYACIIRHSANGDAEWGDEALTQRITISSVDNYLYVEERGMVNGWKTAYVAAPACEEGQPPEESIVQFQIASAEASYTNHLHFKVVKPEVKFGQENLTLPARYEKQVDLPFDVIGINDGTAILKATILDENHQETEHYSIEAAWNTKKQRYFATIHDKFLDPKADVGVPGNYLEYTIKIEARNKTGLVLEGTLPLYRYYMGLVMRMRPEVHCYLEEYDPIHHESKYKKKMPDGKWYVPAEQDCYLKLYGYDEKRNGLYVIDPKPVSVKWKVVGRDDVMRDVLGNETMQLGLDMTLAASGFGPIGTVVSNAHSKVLNEQTVEQHRVLEFQKQIDALGLSFEARWQSSGEGRIYYVLRSVKGVLNAPNRFDAEMEITAEYKGKQYTFSRIVHMLSQPRREFSSWEAEKAAHDRDNQIQEGLWEIEGGIQAAGLNDKLAPLLYFIRLQQDFYDVEYGYDERNIKAIQETYLHAMQREADEAGVEAKEATVADNLKWYTMDWWLQRAYEGHDLLENMHWTARVGVAVASFGFSEIVFNVPHKMKEYVDNGGESRLEAFYVGAYVAVEAYAYELAITVGVGAIGALGARTAKAGKAFRAVAKETLKSGGKVGSKAAKSAWDAFTYGMGRESWTGLKTLVKNQLSWELGAAERFFASRAKSLMDSAKGLIGGSKYAAAEAFAKQQAIQNIENLQTAIELCRWSPTAENALMRNKLIMVCQADKQTMMLLKNPQLLKESKLLYGVDFTVLKRQFNGLLRKMYNETDELVKAELARSTNGKVPFSAIQVKNATGSSARDLVKGATVTFDRDITYYYIVGDKVHYFNQELVEKLYAQNFRKVVNSHTLSESLTKFDPGNLGPAALKKLEELEARKAKVMMQLYDQMPIEDILKHFESYGDDLARMVDKTLYGEALKNPAKVAQAIMHKGISRFDLADQLWRQAGSLDSVLQRNLMQARAVSEMMEGYRQLSKTFKILCDRDAVRHTVTKVPDGLRKVMEQLKQLDGVTATLSEMEAALARQGFNSRSLAETVGHLAEVIG